MLISDVSVRRPVFAAVISLILVIIGAMSVGSMPIREFPDIERPIVSITTDYRGAASDIVERRVTQVLEDQLAGIAGITKISSVSYDERSIITLEFTRDDRAAGNGPGTQQRLMFPGPSLLDLVFPKPLDVADQNTGTAAGAQAHVRFVKNPGPGVRRQDVDDTLPEARIKLAVVDRMRAADGQAFPKLIKIAEKLPK